MTELELRLPTGLCSNCQAWMSTWMKSANSTLPPNAPTSSSTLTQDAKDALFLDHVITVTSYLKEKYPKVSVFRFYYQITTAKYYLLHETSQLYDQEFAD
jgi:hypothetical protein